MVKVNLKICFRFLMRRESAKEISFKIINHIDMVNRNLIFDVN